MTSPDLPVATNTSRRDTTAGGTSPQKKHSWAGVVSLSVGIFALVTAEFLPASLLSRIASDLGVTEGVAGQSVSVTAIIAAIAGLTIPVVLGRVDRRHLMIALSVVAVLSNVLVALAPSYPVLLVARVLLGLTIGGFWSLAISMTARLVPASKLGLGLTIVNVGVSLATVAAVPAGTLLGELWGWRAVFYLAAGVGIIAAVLQVVALPSMRSTASAGFRPLFQTLRSRLILLCLAAMALMGAGHFAGFTYIRPAATEIGGLAPAQLALLLLAYGVGIVGGNLVAGPLADRSLRLAAFVFPLVLGLAMIAFATLDAGAVLLFVAAVLWGAGFGALPTVISTWLARAEPDRLESVGGLQTAVFQVAIALGAFIGGFLVDGAGVQTALVVGGASALAGAVLIVLVKPRPLA
ncbi:MFS transporter (plasmid) [Curtobacterium sp. YC1]|uniref:MFS transporter n=1 Tax=Curtobacterium sp. YC1 TaxID=2795488 RepID=UPI0018E4EE63|nr:MFS transporter [Curtobacterium sp. YC1]QQD77912.1 MFS transporter [Curtobacterium sp. YC1]